MSGYLIRYKRSICTIDRAETMYSVAERAQIHNDDFSAGNLNLGGGEVVRRRPSGLSSPGYWQLYFPASAPLQNGG